MVGVTVEFMAVKPPRIIHKEFKTREVAYHFMDTLQGEHFVASLDDKTLALYVGWKQVKGQDE